MFGGGKERRRYLDREERKKKIREEVVKWKRARLIEEIVSLRLELGAKERTIERVASSSWP